MREGEVKGVRRSTGRRLRVRMMMQQWGEERSERLLGLETNRLEHETTKIATSAGRCSSFYWAV